MDLLRVHPILRGLGDGLELRRRRIVADAEAEPEGVVEGVGAGLGFLDRRVKGDLERFKEFIESRGAETGAWRGEVEAKPQV